MRGTIQTTTAILLATLGLGCATTRAHVALDERDDLSKYETWAWLPRDNVRVEGTDHAAALDGKLARLVERKLLESGFRFSSAKPDFYVTFQLALREHRVVVNEPSAIYELSSLHSSPSIQIEGTRQTTHHYSEMQLAIGMARANGERLWLATFSQNERQLDAVPLDDAVALLLERLPSHDPVNAAEERRRRAICAREMADPTRAIAGATQDEHGADVSPPASCPRDVPNRPRRRPRLPSEPVIPA
jgi:hypothetical protein